MSSRQTGSQKQTKCRVRTLGATAAVLALVGVGAVQQFETPWLEQLRSTTALTSTAHAASAQVDSSGIPVNAGTNIIADNGFTKRVQF